MWMHTEKACAVVDEAGINSDDILKVIVQAMPAQRNPHITVNVMFLLLSKLGRIDIYICRLINKSSLKISY